MEFAETNMIQAYAGCNIPCYAYILHLSIVRNVQRSLVHESGWEKMY